MARIEYGQYKGRQQLVTKVPRDEGITTSNVDDVYREIESALQNNIQQSETLFEYYFGDQAILTRQKVVRPEINTRMVENRAHEIINFKTGYQYGEGCYYVGIGDDVNNKNQIELVNGYNTYIGKGRVDQEHLLDAMVTGRGFRMVREPEEPETLFEHELTYKIDHIDARYGDMIYDSSVTPEPMAFIFFQTDDEGNEIKTFYTKDEIITVREDGTESVPHTMEMIPIVETKLNNHRIGAFEPVLGLLDAVNLLQSDRMNAVEQFIQSILIMVDVDFIDDEQGRSLMQVLQDSGGLKLKSGKHGKPSVEFLTQELTQSDAQVLKHDILSAINEITALPDRMGNTKGSGDTGIAVELRDGWANAETYARNVDPYLESSEKQLVKLIAMCYNTGNSGELNPFYVNVEFNRNPVVETVNSTQAMLVMRNLGIHPKYWLTISGLFDDVEQVLADSEETIEQAFLAEIDTERTANTESERTENTDETERTVNETREELDE